MRAAEAIAASMSMDMGRMASVSQNLVNASTPGYHREVARAQPFTAWMAGTSSTSSSMPVDMRAGHLRDTNQALDVAIDTPGAYFEVQTTEGFAYTRRGDLTLDAMGTLCDHAGHPLVGQGGTITVMGGSPVISADGTVKVGDKVVGQLKLMQFDDPSKLMRGDGALFLQGAAEASPSPTVAVRQHHLESSNVDTAAEMVTLIETMRHFEAGQRVLQGMDDMMDRAMRKLGDF
jgi:flagellar basal-body rod protein FlgG